MLDYTIRYYDKLLMALLEHLQLVIITLLISAPLALLISLIISRYKALYHIIYSVLLLIYCIPSIALFSLMIPLFGLGKGTAIIGMTAYNLILLLRNITTARNAIPGAVRDAAAGLGLDNKQIMKMIYFPIMLPYLISGLRIATVSTTGIATMAGLINAGGLGNILFEGMRMYHMPKIIWGIILVSGLALVVNAIFAKLENKAVLWANGGKK
ncbi:MAG: ABC transporter permease [Lachnospiraceae bacterium]|jgi:osmoprotectant transport system permease protein